MNPVKLVVQAMLRFALTLPVLVVLTGLSLTAMFVFLHKLILSNATRNGVQMDTAMQAPNSNQHYWPVYCTGYIKTNLMENIQASSLKNKGEVISDLKELLELVNDGKEGYQSAAEATENPELKALFSRISGERIVYAAELKEHIELHGEHAENSSGGILGKLHRSWLSIKQTFSSNDDKAILTAITTGERSAIEAYDKCIADYADHADHLTLLKEQRDGIQSALAEVERHIVS